MLLEYIEHVDDKLFKKYSCGKDFNSFISEFYSTTNKEDKEKIVKELKEIDDIVHHNAKMKDDFSEYKYKLFKIANAIEYFLYEYSKNGWVIYKIINHFMEIVKKYFFLLYIKMYLISAERYKNANVAFLTIKTNNEIWASMKDIGSGIGVKNISDLVLK